MKIKEFTLSRSVKLSIDFNSIQSTASITVEVGEDDNINDVYKQLEQLLENIINQDLQSQKINLIKQTANF